MLGLFKSKPLLSVQDLEFQVETYKWLLRSFGGKEFYDEAILVLPTKEHFPSEVTNEDEVAAKTFEAVKKLAGMDSWPCKLEKQEQDVSLLVAPTVTLQNVPNSPLGTFGISESDEVVISYNPDIVNEPTQLVATFAHELAHYLTGTSEHEPPGGWDNWEFATDIAAVFLGFGVFMSNAAFSFKQTSNNETQGWQTNRSGYLTEVEYVYSLAIFIGLKGIEVKQASKFLKPSLVKILKKAVSELSKTEILTELKAIQYVPISS